MRSLSLSRADFERIKKLDTCTASNAIERLNGRPRNEGSASGREVRSLFPQFPPILGYAVTGRMRSTTAPVAGRAYYENLHWWRYLTTIPEPRVMVIEDVDDKPGLGALFGELHAHICRALGCIGYVTNGSVRDIRGLETLRFPVFAGSVAVSHMYAHVAGFGEPVTIGGLDIAPGDLIHADCHGVHTIPLSIAADIPNTAAQLLREERELIELCHSPRFSLEALDEKLRHLPEDGDQVLLDAK